MSHGETTFLVLLIAFAVGYMLTHVVRIAAALLGLTDCPDGRRKLHGSVTPLGGGLAVYLATVAVVAVLWLVPNPWRADLRAIGGDLLGLLAAGAVIVAVGLVDDRIRLRGRYKLLGQFAAASILIANGLVIERIELFGYGLDLWLLAVPFTYFWFFGAINSVNLMDGIDGLATILGIILAATFAILAAMVGGRGGLAIVSLVFAGALGGFLRFNLPPATVFLGDAGSMLIGLVVGALAIMGSLKGPGTVLLAAPLAVWTLPIFDSAAAIIRRKLTGRSIYAADRAHLHHHLLNRLGSNRRVLLWVGICCAVTSAAALVGVLWKSDLLALAVCFAVVMMFVITGLFGQAECVLLWVRSRELLGRLLGRLQVRAPRVSETAVRLQGSRPWDLLWTTLTESAEKLALGRIRLDLNLPMVHEEFHATWERAEPAAPEETWELEIPLYAGGHLAGRLAIAGRATGDSAAHDLERLMELVEPFESRLRGLVVPDRPPGGDAAAPTPLADPRENPPFVSSSPHAQWSDA